MAKNHGPQIKNDEKYSELREHGMSREKAARIANAGPKASKRGGHASSYEDWSRDELYDRAREIGIEGRSDMDEDELISALRNH